MKSTYLRSMVGLAFFIGAFVFFGISSGFAKPAGSFDSAWTFFITIPAIIWIFIFGTNIINSLMFFTGFGFLVYESGWIGDTELIPFIIILSLMAVGLNILGSIGKIPVCSEVLKKKQKQNDTETISLKASLINANYSNISENIKGGAVSVNFCTAAYDLSHAKIEQDVELKLSVSFGNLVVILPAESKVIVNSNAYFGHVVNKTADKSQKDGKTVSINAGANFGDIIILDGVSPLAPTNC